MPTQHNIDTTHLNSLLLASTLMQTMRAKTKELNQEDNAFKTLEAVATTSSKDNKDDATYEEYKSTHTHVPERERNFLRTLIHF